jgi:thiol-disulfide isomerase/thioredoxin
VRAPFAASLLLFASCRHAPDPAPTDGPQPLRTLEAVREAIRPHGRPRVVHVWALWCPSCTGELSRQVAWARALKAAGADVVFLDADAFEQSDQVRRALAAAGADGVVQAATLDMALDVREVTRLLSANWSGNLPATFALAPDAGPVAQVIGAASEEDLNRLERALSIQLAPVPDRRNP